MIRLSCGSTPAPNTSPNNSLKRGPNSTARCGTPGQVPVKAKCTVNAEGAKHLVTLHISTPHVLTETLSYAYSGAHVLNGVFLPGHEPSTHPTLTLTQGVPCLPGTACSHIAFPAIKYNQTASVGGEGSTCGGFVGLPCAAGFVCKAAATCCDMPGVCVKAGGPPPGAVGLPMPSSGN